MNARWLMFTAFGFVLFHGWPPAQAQTTRYTVSDPGTPLGAQGSCAQAGHRTNFAAAPAGVKEASAARRLPTFYQEDTPFSTQVRVPIVDLWGGHLLIDGFYLQISANTVFRGLPQSGDLWWAAPASLSLRSIRSYGINLSFRLRVDRRRTLRRYLFGEGA